MCEQANGVLFGEISRVSLVPLEIVHERPGEVTSHVHSIQYYSFLEDKSEMKWKCTELIKSGLCKSSTFLEPGSFWNSASTKSSIIKHWLEMYFNESKSLMIDEDLSISWSIKNTNDWKYCSFKYWLRSKLLVFTFEVGIYYL